MYLTFQPGKHDKSKEQLQNSGPQTQNYIFFTPHQSLTLGGLINVSSHKKSVYMYRYVAINAFNRLHCKFLQFMVTKEFFLNRL